MGHIKLRGHVIDLAVPTREAIPEEGQYKKIFNMTTIDIHLDTSSHTVSQLEGKGQGDYLIPSFL